MTVTNRILRAKMEGIDALDCPCGCHDVGMITKHQPDVTTFDEFAKQHEDMLGDIHDVVSQLLAESREKKQEE